jgi:threonine/homoserine/homoserine lactone efflux protein
MESEKNRRRQVPDFRAWLDYGMAALMVFFGVFIVFSEKILGYDYFEDSWLITGGMKWAIGIMFALYGAFRAYRGYLLSQRRKSED